MPRPIDADPVATKRRLLLAATRLVVSEQSRGLTLRAVASSAGLSLGMVRHYFGSKAGLIEACHLFAVARFEQVARQFVQVLVRADVGARRSGLVALAEQVREQPEPLALWCRDFGGRRRGADEPSMSQACATWATALEDRFERPSGSLPVRLWLVLGLFIRGATVDSPTLMDLTDAGRSQLDGQLADACLIALGLADGADRA